MIWCNEACGRSARWLRIFMCAAAGLVCASFGALANAQATDVAATARALFDEGRALLERKDYVHACPKFEESQRLDPGGGTLLNLALCHELMGKTATAWAEFDEGLRIARRDQRADREEFAQQHILALQPTLSRLRIIVPPETRLPELRVRRNGVELGEATWGDAIPVDPGQQILEISAPGKISARITIDVPPEGKTGEVSVPPLADEASAPPNVPALAASTSPPATSNGAPLADDTSPVRAGAQRWLGGIVAGTGLATLGVATYLTVRALELKHDADRDCCGASAVLESRRAVSYANAGTAVSISGFLLTGLGTYLFLSTPSPHRAGASIDFGQTGVSARVAGQF